LELTLNKVDRFDPASASKTFTIGFPSAVLESVVLPKLLRNVFKLAPRVDISAVRAERHELESELSAGTLDAAIDMLMPLSEDIRRQRLRGEWYVVVARRNHPSVRAGLDMTTYLEQDHIQASARRRGLSMEDFELGRHNLRRRIRLRCQHYFAACQVVSETDLILTMPESYARIINPQFNNQLLPFPLKVPVFDTFLYWHVNAENDPANAWLRQQLINAAQDVSATVATRRSSGKRQLMV
jgi:DNA-binding transcriptional LysR family regulator